MVVSADEHPLRPSPEQADQNSQLGGSDTIYGRGGDDTLDGGDGDDWLADLSGSNRLIGSAGNDEFWYVSGSPGESTLSGGIGSDSFELSPDALAPDASADVITDFGAGEGGDRIDLTFLQPAFGEGSTGSLNWFATGHLRLEREGDDTVLRASLTGGVAPEDLRTILILRGTDPSSLTADNFHPAYAPVPIATAPTEGSDALSKRRHLRRISVASAESKTLVAERVQHVNRIKGLLFGQGIGDYEPLRRDRRDRLEGLTTGDGRPVPRHLKTQSGRELDRPELLLEQIKAVEAERDTLLARIREASAAQAAGMLLGLKASGAEFAALLWSEGMFRSFTNRWSAAAYPVWS